MKVEKAAIFAAFFLHLNLCSQLLDKNEFIMRVYQGTSDKVWANQLVIQNNQDQGVERKQ